ncbi:hypothetical protein FB451DRAFT_1386212 [Mycena latifolia]|nr:hypothetical protein FB451DRAFT_1386212 [Mycena latifolia]
MPDDAQVLTDALTTMFCHLHFGDSVVGNAQYLRLGFRLYLLAVSLIAYQKLPSNSSAEMDDVRLECMDRTLLARIALLLLDAHLRVLRTVDDHSKSVPPAQCADAFLAFVGAVHLQFGWDALFRWLDPLLSPWVDSQLEHFLDSINEKESNPRTFFKLRFSDD